MKQKIAFDFHGVLETYPEIFKYILMPMRMENYIYVLSGPPLKQIHQELQQKGYMLGVHYDHIISVVDWVKEQGIPMYQHENRSWCCDDYNWWSSKAKICREYGIKVLFDDSIQYSEHIVDNDPLFIHINTV